VPNQLELGATQQMSYVGFGTGKEVIDTDNVLAHGNQAITQVAAEEACASGHQYPMITVSFQLPAPKRSSRMI
jgi:hypothetical protein